jgi:type IV pilus assembly protein PilW
MLKRRIASKSIARDARARGLSIVELMVGVAVGMILVAGAASLFVTHVGGSRDLVREMRVNQDLRAAADVIVRDLRRAGYWGNAVNGVLNNAMGSATAPNPYSGLSGTYGTSSSEIFYNFSRDVTENDTVDAGEQFGFRLSGGVVQMKTDASTWQDVTDAGIVTVTKLQITDTPTQLAMGGMCSQGCNTTPPTPPTAPTAACPNPPAITLHRFDILIEGQAANDARIKRTLRESVRLRNNPYSGQCP